MVLLILLPALAEAAPGPASAPTATSGDGTMELSWSSVTGSTDGYEYRYSDDIGDLFKVFEAAWIRVGDDANDVSATIAKGVLTVGTTYYFQIRDAERPARGAQGPFRQGRQYGGLPHLVQSKRQPYH